MLTLIKVNTKTVGSKTGNYNEYKNVSGEYNIEQVVLAHYTL